MGTPANPTPMVPFPEGQAANMSHGARSPKVYGEVARQYAAVLLLDRPDLEAFPEAVAAWAQAEAQAALMRRRLDEVGTFTDDGEPRSALLQWSRLFDRDAANHRTALGLDPRSAITLAKDRAETAVAALSVAEFAEANREARLAREAELAAVPDVAGEVLATVQAEAEAVLDVARQQYLSAKRATEEATA